MKNQCATTLTLYYNNFSNIQTTEIRDKANFFFFFYYYFHFYSVHTESWFARVTLLPMQKSGKNLLQ